jgi:hypothetical protein
VLRWYLVNYITQSPPVPQAASPINILLLGAPYYLAISEQNYLGGFTAANITPSAGCTAATPATSVAVAAATPAMLPTAAPATTTLAQSLVYESVTAGASIALPLPSACTITVTDNYHPLAGPSSSPASISVQVTAASGYGQ